MPPLRVKNPAEPETFIQILFFKDFRDLNQFLVLKFGREGGIVVEPSSVIVFELEAYPEPKVLVNGELTTLLQRFTTTVAVAKFVGASQAFVWEKLNPYRNQKDKPK
jgi:hypothetical protein